MKSKQTGVTLIELLIVLLVLVSIGGWIANIIKMVHQISDPLTALELFRIFGIVIVPLGVVLGFC